MNPYKYEADPIDMMCPGDNEYELLLDETPEYIREWIDKARERRRPPMGDRIEQLLLFGTLDQRKEWFGKDKDGNHNHN